MAVKIMAISRLELLKISWQEFRISHLITSESSTEKPARKKPEMRTPHSPSQKTALLTWILYSLVIFSSAMNIRAKMSWEAMIRQFPNKGLDWSEFRQNSTLCIRVSEVGVANECQGEGDGCHPLMLGDCQFIPGKEAAQQVGEEEG